jgi:hypothetical protein
MNLITWLSSYQPTKKRLSLLFFSTFALRAAVFFFYVQHEQRYQQPDSGDYHIYATTIVTNSIMPRYWRTPGYPVYLAPFYAFFLA